MLPMNGRGAPLNALSGKITADADLVVAPGAGKALEISTINFDCTVAQGGKRVDIVGGSGVILATFSIAATGSFPTKVFDPPFRLADNTKLSADTDGTTGEFNIATGYYRASNQR